MNESKFQINPSFDDDGYPSKETLNYVSWFDVLDTKGFFKFSERTFNKHYGSWQEISGYQNPEIYDNKPFNAIRITTGGWSGNEMLITAMQANVMWYGYIKAHFTGGVYIFDADKMNQ